VNIISTIAYGLPSNLPSFDLTRHIHVAIYETVFGMIVAVSQLPVLTMAGAKRACSAACDSSSNYSDWKKPAVASVRRARISRSSPIITRKLGTACLTTLESIEAHDRVRAVTVSSASFQRKSRLFQEVGQNNKMTLIVG